jgi:hypothetical protein
MKDYPIRLGSILFTMVEPHKGHEVEYNRWYERDHFYAGCMIGAYTFAGQRWVATRDLKALREPATPTPITPDPSIGSYLALYWILAGHHDEWNRWGVDQVKWLHANGRMFAERDHIHTLLYNYEWGVLRDPDGPSAELALDHRYPGLAVVVAESTGPRDRLESWYREHHLPAKVAAAPVGQVLAFTPQPLLHDAPGDVPRVGSNDTSLLLLCFLEEEPTASWPSLFGDHAAELDASGAGRLVWASPFIPTIPGTDTYADQL